MIRSAAFSRCRTYRYTLERRWDPRRPVVMFVGLNPSTADETHDDPTVRRCLGFARRWRFAALLMTNLFALRSTDPRALREAEDPIGPRNDEHLRRCRARAALVVAAWGARGGLGRRDERVLVTLPEAHCLGATRGGRHRHPLYLPSSARLRRLR